MAITLEIEGSNIVLVGNFNPAIFSPFWLFSVGLIEEADYKSAVLNIIHPEVAQFQLDWVQITVEQQKISFISLGPVSIKVYDLACRLFVEALPHTPLKAMGINFLSHFRVSSERVMHMLGDTLAPKQPWGEWAQSLSQRPPKDHPVHLSQYSRAGGLKSITMANYVREDKYPGSLQVKVETSAQYQPGFYIEVNSHINLPDRKQGEDNAIVLRPFSEHFDECVRVGRGFVSHFMSLCEGFEREA